MRLQTGTAIIRGGGSRYIGTVIVAAIIPLIIMIILAVIIGGALAAILGPAL
jgi:hypothetical protein